MRLWSLTFSPCLQMAPHMALCKKATITSPPAHYFSLLYQRSVGTVRSTVRIYAYLCLRSWMKIYWVHLLLAQQKKRTSEISPDKALLFSKGGNTCGKQSSCNLVEPNFFTASRLDHHQVEWPSKEDWLRQNWFSLLLYLKALFPLANFKNPYFISQFNI